MDKIFLGGTCNNDNWRNELIPFLKKEYFNPVVEDWTENCQAVENDEKENKCNIHLYIITGKMVGVYSIAEAVESVFNKTKKTFFCVFTLGFTNSQIKSLKAVIKLINKQGGNAFIAKDIFSIAKIINQK